MSRVTMIEHKPNGMMILSRNGKRENISLPFKATRRWGSYAGKTSTFTIFRDGRYYQAAGGQGVQIPNLIKNWSSIERVKHPAMNQHGDPPNPDIQPEHTPDQPIAAVLENIAKSLSKIAKELTRARKKVQGGALK